MAFGNQFHMPGSYQFEGPGASSAALNADMFRPPISPSSSTYNLAKSTGSLLSDNSLATNNTTYAARLGRKRTHDESTARGAYLHHGNRESPMEDSTRGQHHYTLAGQIETPGTQASPKEGLLDESMYSDADYRRALGSKRPHDEADMSPPLGFTGLVNPEMGDSLTPRTAGWTTFAFQAIGGVVGKVWEFCKGGAGAFRGFQAGGGKAYVLNGQPVPTLSPVEPNHALSSNPEETPISPSATYPQSDIPNYTSPIQYDNQNFGQAEEEPEPDTTLEQPAAKRRQTGLAYENDELRRNWVMVEEDEPLSTPTRSAPSIHRSPTASTPSSRIPAARRPSMSSRLQQPRVSTPGRRISVPSPRFSGDRSSIPMQTTPRTSMASVASYAGNSNSPSLSAREPASFASPRSPDQAVSPNPFTPVSSRIPQPKGFGPNPFANIRTASPIQPRVSPSRPTSRQSINQSPLTTNPFVSKIATPNGHRKSASTTSVGSARGRQSLSFENPNKIQTTSPRLDNEGKKLATKRFAAEKRADSRLDRLNAELQGLIRQGQEALGTTFDVDMEESWEEA